MADAGDDVVEQVARALGVELAEAERVEHADRPGAEREDVAEDPADPGRRPLERLDRARVVVGLDLERDRVAVADVDRAGVLARAHDDARALGRQPAQQLPGVLVGAVLGPEQREHRQLDLVRIAAHQLDDPRVLGVGQPQRAMGGLPRGRRRGAHRSSIAKAAAVGDCPLSRANAMVLCRKWGRDTPTRTRCGRRSASGRGP